MVFVEVKVLMRKKFQVFKFIQKSVKKEISNYEI